MLAHDRDLLARCPACGGEKSPGEPLPVEDHEYRVAFQARYAACGSCRTAFQVPMPSSAELAAFYPGDYHSMTPKGFLSRLKNRGRFRRLLQWIDRDSTVLDYGCGDGTFIAAAARALPGARFFGYEIAPSFSRKELENGAVTLIHGSFDDLLRELPPCRLVTMNHVIEHLPDPAQTLSGLRGKLVEGGILEGQTPASGSLEHRVFGPSWSGYHAPRHTVIFSPDGISTLLQKLGFDTVTTESAFNPAALAVSLASSVQRAGSASRVRRTGLSWLLWLAAATLLAPVDLASGSAGIMNFAARKAGP